MSARPPQGVLGAVGASAAGYGPDQFQLLRLGDEKKPILSLEEVTPDVAGSEAEPDVVASVSLTSFHLDQSKKVADTTRATFRMDVGKDDASSSALEPLFWSIASGIDLWKHWTDANKSDPKRLNQDFGGLFKRRPAEIPGGLGRLRIEVLAHPEPSWWRKLLSFGTSEKVGQLISSIGFPGITLEAVRMLDGFLSQFDEANATRLFSSRPLTVAFSQKAKDDFLVGGENVSLGSLSSGFYIMVRTADVGNVAKYPPHYLAASGLLVPRETWAKDGINFKWDENPYNEISYAVLRAKTRATKIAFA